MQIIQIKIRKVITLDYSKLQIPWNSELSPGLTFVQNVSLLILEKGFVSGEGDITLGKNMSFSSSNAESVD